MSQGKAIRSLPFRKPQPQADPNGKEKEDENRQIGMKTRGENFSFQIEKRSQSN